MNDLSTVESGNSAVHSQSHRENSANISSEENETIVYRPREHVVDRSGSWIKAAGAIMTTTTLPTLLALPSALAALGWAAGIVLILITSLGVFYCFHRLVSLNNYDGKRHLTYPDLAVAISGKPWMGTMVRSFQFSINWGVAVANILMAASFMQDMYQVACTTNCAEMTLTKWTLVACGALALLGLLPDISERNALIIISGTFTLFYTSTSIYLSFRNNQHTTASYALAATSEAGRVFNALEALGILFFLYGDTMYPEVQSFLKPDENNSTVSSMLKGMYLAFSITIPLLLTLAVVGYWAFGATVSPILLTASFAPRALVSITVIFCIIQLVYSNQIFAQPVYNWFETKIMKRWPKATWMQKRVIQKDGQHVAVPSLLFMLLFRTFYVGTVALVAVIFNFFSAIMGLIGAVGLTPLAYLVPLYLWMKANEKTMSGLDRLLHVSMFIMFGGGGILAAIGAVRSIVVSFSTFTLG